MSSDDALRRAMPIEVELDSFEWSYGTATVSITLPDSGEIRLEFDPDDSETTTELFNLIGRLVTERLRGLEGREIIVTGFTQLDIDESWETDD